MTTLLAGTVQVPERIARPADPKISIVVPTINEARNLEELLPRLPSVHEVILVDGGSTDGTVETARRIIPDIRVFQQTRQGKGNALAVGSEQVTGDIVVMLDAGGSADPAEIDRFVTALFDGADFPPRAAASPRAAEAATSHPSAGSPTAGSTSRRTWPAAPSSPICATATTPSGPT